MKEYTVCLIADAEEDLYDIYRFLFRYSSRRKAEEVLTALEKSCMSLAGLAERGHIPPELERIAVYDYKEIHYGQYRILYQIEEDTVCIHTILDGRRDMQNILERRLLR